MSFGKVFITIYVTRITFVQSSDRTTEWFQYLLGS